MLNPKDLPDLDPFLRRKEHRIARIPIKRCVEPWDVNYRALDRNSGGECGSHIIIGRNRADNPCLLRDATKESFAEDKKNTRSTKNRVGNNTPTAFCVFLCRLCSLPILVAQSRKARYFLSKPR